jgi:hypothetical protein
VNYGDSVAGCEVTTLVLCGPPGKYKTALLHMIAQEFTVGSDTDHYVYFKGGVDNGGMLSWAGELQSGAFFACDDVEIRDKHGKIVKAEPMKALLDPVSGGSIDGMRYHVLECPAKMPRALFFNGVQGGFGAWFRKHGFPSIGDVLDALFGKDGEITNETLVEARAKVLALGGDEGAILRRISVGYVSEDLACATTLEGLQAASASSSSERNEKRSQHWAKQAAAS